MNEVAIELSKELRDPKGEAVDVIIALTHCRVTNVRPPPRFRVNETESCPPRWTPFYAT